MEGRLLGRVRRPVRDPEHPARVEGVPGTTRSLRVRACPVPASARTAAGRAATTVPVTMVVLLPAETAGIGHPVPALPVPAERVARVPGTTPSPRARACPGRVAVPAVRVREDRVRVLEPVPAGLVPVPDRVAHVPVVRAPTRG